MKKIRIIATLLMLPLLCAAQEKFGIIYGPYLQKVGETEATVVWVTSGDAVSWVELAPDDGSHFYAGQRPKYFDAQLGKKKVGTLHKVTVGGLKPGDSYRYRILSRQVKQLQDYYVEYGPVAASAVFNSQPYKFSTLDKGRERTSFRVVNDIHSDNELLLKFTEGMKDNKPDFVVFNGDMVSSMNSRQQVFDGYMDTACKEFASEIPMFFARGNHDARGTFSPEFLDYFPSSTGEPYYMFRSGPACIVVLDGGEDKPDSDIEYWELADFDAFREKQAKWLSEAVRTDDFKNASFRIVIIHVPPVVGNSPDSGGGLAWHGSIHAHDLFVPILNEAGIDLMLCGHLHRHVYLPAGSEAGGNFPIIVNSNRCFMDVKVDRSGIEVEVKDAERKVVSQWKFTGK